MIVNTLRFRYDRGKYGRLNDPVTRGARSALALIISAVIVVQAARYLEGVTGEVVVLGVFLTCDYLVINWLRSAERGKQAARSELSTYNYVPHAERRTW